MKKVLALALALVMAFSMSAMAFAADSVCGKCGSKFQSDEALAEHVADCEGIEETPVEPTLECPICKNKFADENAYNDHIAVCKTNNDGFVANISIQEILNTLIELIKVAPSIDFSVVESIIVKLVDFIQNIGTAAVSEAEVKGAVADLEAALGDVEIPAISDLLNALKQKIKDLYAGEVATTVEVTTVIEKPATTGSSSVGIAVFAAVSVAAAAAYVCTKKSK